MTNTALILGITGGFGHATAQSLLQHGWCLRALSRNIESAQRTVSNPGCIEWVQGNAMDVDEIILASRGVDVIVHGVNPPAYKNWMRFSIPMLKNSIAAAKSAAATLVFPGNIYNYSPGTFPIINEQTQQNPQTEKGKIRVAMENLLHAQTAQGLRVLIVRAGDFFGAPAPGSWLNAMVKPGRCLEAVVYPGDPDAGHAWAYLPDLGETVAQLLGRRSQLESFAVFHFAGHYFDRGIEMADAIGRAAGIDTIRIKKLPWLAIQLLSPTSALLRGIVEMRYLWQHTARLDNTKLLKVLGNEPHTALNRALYDTLRGLQVL